MVLELWPELRNHDLDRISLHMRDPGEPERLVRVPKIVWRHILRDLSRYEVLHVHLDRLPPSPKYQGGEKVKEDGKSGGDDDKGRQSRGFFSSIKRMFRG
jgi:hypothetical protein